MVRKETLARLRKRLDEIDEVKEINKFNVADVRELVVGCEELLQSYEGVEQENGMDLWDHMY